MQQVSTTTGLKLCRNKTNRSIVSGYPKGCQFEESPFNKLAVTVE